MGERRETGNVKAKGETGKPAWKGMGAKHSCFVEGGGSWPLKRVSRAAFRNSPATGSSGFPRSRARLIGCFPMSWPGPLARQN